MSDIIDGVADVVAERAKAVVTQYTHADLLSGVEDVVDDMYTELAKFNEATSSVRDIIAMNGAIQNVLVRLLVANAVLAHRAEHRLEG